MQHHKNQTWINNLFLTKNNKLVDSNKNINVQNGLKKLVLVSIYSIKINKIQKWFQFSLLGIQHYYYF